MFLEPEFFSSQI